MQYFYDTCALLNNSNKIFENNDLFYISSITLKELENIKNSLTKDAETKYKARKLVNLLFSKQNNFKTIMYQKEWDDIIKQYPTLPDNNDSRIIISAKQLSNNSITFVTQDFCCYLFAKSIGLNVQYLLEDIDNYTGYKIVKCTTDEEIADFYSKVYSDNILPIPMHENEYLFIKDSTDKIVDKYYMRDNKLISLKDYPIFNSKMFGETKPRDAYQWAAMDSLQRNTITLLRGAAGTGKSYLAMSYLMSLLDEGKIDRIIIFCNTVATNGAARLGFYPGSKDEKLLDSQIGNFLVSKLGGDKNYVIDKFIDTGKIVLLPMADIRGYDTSGMHAGIYITEAQNMDIELMKLALQRIGNDSVCILDGDDQTQVDLGIYAGNNNGIRRVSQVFRGESIYGEITLPNIYRSKIAAIAQKM